MASNFIQGAIKRPGALHRALGVPQGKKIPQGMINAAAKKGGRVGQEARFAKTLHKINPGHKAAAKSRGKGGY
jgi:hypothetical protein